MTKQEFLIALRERLCGLPKQDVEERLGFYSEMIDDRIEDGCTEEEAVLAIGSVDGIAAQIIADIPLTKIAKESIKPKKRFKAWEIVLLALGSPIWISLLIAAFAVIFSLYVSLWSVIASLWAVFGAFVGSSVGIFASGIIVVCGGNTLSGVAMISAAMVLAGMSVFMFYGCNAATKGVLALTKKMAIWIKNCFIGKEKA